VKVRFWGTRGSIPVSVTAPEIRRKLITALSGSIGRNLDSVEAIERYVDEELGFDVRGTFGGHSSCVELETGGSEHVIFDMGSGARPLGQSLLQRHGAGAPQTYHVFMSHVHWDHIMGFPFFTPAYIKGNRIRIHGGHEELETAFRRQQAAPSFPVDFSMLGADIEFVRLEPGRTHDIAGMSVQLMLQKHSGDSYAYRFSSGGKSVVYSTDSEHTLTDLAETHRFVDFFRGADLVIFDAMYSLAESLSVNADWGHSSNMVGVELCHMAGVRHLCLFHHEPVHSDETIARVLAETQRYEELSRGGGYQPLLVSAAYDGMEIVL
jgi:phosphoribosyl 1,2-cyclic phosphodiesterase